MVRGIADPSVVAQLSGGTPDPRLVDVFRRVRQDARSDPKPTEAARPFTIVFSFDGVTALPTIGDAIIVPLGRIPGRIVGATLITNGPGSATVDLKLSNVTAWPSGLTVYDTIPTITGVGPTATELNTSQWRVNLQPADILYATLLSATGTFTALTFSLECIRLTWPSGSATITDQSGNSVIDTLGDPIAQRN